MVEDALAPLAVPLDPLPVLAHAPGRPGLDFSEHVRVPLDELRVDPARHSLEIAVALLAEKEREKVDLEEQIAELVEQLGAVIGKRGLRDLICLFDGVRHDRARRLLAVPRTLDAEPLGQLLEL